VTVTVLRCIGCGMIETPQPCVGTCIDRRLDLVDGAEHTPAMAAVSALEAALAQRRTLLARLARSADWEALRAPARAALRLHSPVTPGTIVTTWACDSCGRIEAPQPCIGVCVRPETPMVDAAEHRATIETARALERALERLAPVLRQVAWVRPDPSARERTGRALRAAAQIALSADLDDAAGPDRLTGDEPGELGRGVEPVDQSPGDAAV